MKLVYRQDLLKLPAGTLFVEHFSTSSRNAGLLVKGDTIYHNGAAIDFFVDSEIPGGYDGFRDYMPPADLTTAEASNLPSAVEPYGYRDGLFDDKAVYIVFERADVVAVVQRLHICLHAAYGEPK